MRVPIFRSSGAQHKRLPLLCVMLLSCSAVYAAPEQKPDDIEFSNPSHIQSEEVKARDAELNNTIQCNRRIEIFTQNCFIYSRHIRK